MGAFKNLMIGEVQVKNFNELEAELKRLNENANEKREKLFLEAFEVLTAKLRKRSALKEYIGKLEVSKDLMFDETEWPCRWIRFDASQFIDTSSKIQKDSLERYLDENFCTRIDYENEAILMSDGPCILINEDGDVLDQDSGKWIINANDYINDDGLIDFSKRNELIEEWMEKSGYFPSVVSCDRHGNVFYVSTKEKT